MRAGSTTLGAIIRTLYEIVRSPELDDDIHDIFLFVTAALLPFLVGMMDKHDGDPEEPTGHFAAGRILIMISRREHWQMGYVIPKGSLDELRTQGMKSLRSSPNSMMTR